MADKPLGHVLAQIKANNYAQKYRNQTAEVWGIGVEFSKADKQIVAFETKKL